MHLQKQLKFSLFHQLCVSCYFYGDFCYLELSSPHSLSPFGKVQPERPAKCPFLIQKRDRKSYGFEAT